MLKDIVERIIKEQEQNQDTILVGHLYYPVDISLANGNILLRKYRIISIENNKIKGITWKEEYSAPRENREQVFSYFDFDEIASLECFDLSIIYEKPLTINRS